MRISIMALGSRGDVQRFVPLGRALQSAGHTVKIATFSLFESMVRRAGLDFHYIRGDAKTLVRTAVGGGLLNRNIDPVRAFRALKQSYGQLTKTLPEDIARLNKCEPKPIPFEELSAERLAKTIRSAVSDQELIRQASKLGDKLRKENGISRAVEIIESLQ